jgi:trehalose 6-phosphate phosphatase
MLARFFAAMPGKKVHALLLDYDGTLAPFHADPAMAVPYPPIRELLQRIQASGRSRIVIVSGRRAKEVKDLLGVARIEVWGCHGLERLAPDGRLSQLSLDPATLEELEQSTAMLEKAGLARLMERKPTGNAVHWRALASEDAARLKREVEEVWESLGDKHSLRMLRFDGGIEICAAVIDKGRVVDIVAAELGDSYCMAYLGDDITDEDAFRAIKRIGIGALVKGEYRETSADIWLRPPDDVIAFLESWAGSGGSRP